MAIPTLAQLIEVEPGCVLPTSADAKTELLNDVVGEVIEYLPVEVLLGFATAEAIPVAGLSTVDKRLLEVRHTDYGHPVPIAPRGFLNRFTKAGDHTYRSPYLAFELGGKVYVYERGVTTALSLGEAYTIALPSNIDGSEDGSTAKTVGALLGRNSVRLVAELGKLRILGDTISNIREDDLLAISILTVGTVPTAAAAPSISAGSQIVPSTVAKSDPTAPSVAVPDDAADKDPSAVTKATAGSGSASSVSDEDATADDIDVATSFGSWETKPQSGGDVTEPTTPSTAAAHPTIPTVPTLASPSVLTIPDGSGTDFVTFFDKDLAASDRIIAHFDAVIKEYAANYAALVEEFNAKYSTFAKQVDRFGQDLSAKVAHQTSTYGAEVQQYGLKVQAEIASHKAEFDILATNARMGTEVALQNARTALEAAAATAQLATAVSQSDAEHTTAVNVSDYQGKLALELQKVRGQLEVVLNNSGVGTQVVLQKFEADWAASLEVSKQALTLSMANTDNTLQAQVLKFEGDLKAAIDQYGALLGRHQSQMAQYLGEAERQQSTMMGRLREAKGRIEMIQEQMFRVGIRYRERRRRYIKQHYPSGTMKLVRSHAI